MACFEPEFLMSNPIFSAFSMIVKQLRCAAQGIGPKVLDEKYPPFSHASPRRDSPCIQSLLHLEASQGLREQPHPIGILEYAVMWPHLLCRQSPRHAVRPLFHVCSRIGAGSRFAGGSRGGMNSNYFRHRDRAQPERVIVPQVRFHRKKETLLCPQASANQRVSLLFRQRPSCRREPCHKPS